MTPEVALILGIDGLANGAVYLLAVLGLVLIFSVTRVVFVPFGDVAAFSALSLAAFEAGRRPATIGAVLGWGVLPALPCLLAWTLAGQQVPHAVFIATAILLVVPITPLVARIAL